MEEKLNIIFIVYLYVMLFMNTEYFVHYKFTYFYSPLCHVGLSLHKHVCHIKGNNLLITVVL